MKWSRSFIPTLKEDPQDAEAVSHKLMVRGGFTRRLSAGAYTYLPMGFKVLSKVKNIIREEMTSAGAVELLMPALQPPELWKRTGRYDDIGDVMMKIKDRHGKELVLGPTHEEIITDLVSREIRSYKDLPVTLYQIQTKFRDEVRSRFGVIRSCEFIMKDAYSFGADMESMLRSYDKMYEAYCRIFERCGLPYVAVEADSGMMGGSGSHEFMVPADIGEDRIVLCSSCGYSASTEVAGACVPGEINKTPLENMEEVSTPGLSTVEEVSAALKVGRQDLIKTLLYMADGIPVAVLIRGDHEANEVKIKKYLGARSIELADAGKIEEVTGGAMGFSGPVGLSDVRIIADHSVKNLTNAVTGANEKDKHLRNVNEGRDYNVNEWLDARVITREDKCPKCSGGIDIKYAIEIGHTFKLGTKYTETLNASFLDASGREKPIIMGCYGIGVNRILASLIENSHDDSGIIWPVSISPCEVVVTPVKYQDDILRKEAEAIYKGLIENGIDAIIDDREKTPGVKFKDADLVGFPFQIVIGHKSLEEGKVEFKVRKSGEKTLIDKNKVLECVKEQITS